MLYYMPKMFTLKGKSRKFRTIRKKTQKLWKQKGCSKNKMGGCNCALFGGLRRKKQKGGCGSCNLKGGSNALIGSMWTPKIEGWPGVTGQANNLSFNNYNTSVDRLDGQERSNISVGGGGSRFRNKTRRNKRGGGLIPQDLVNFGRTLTYGMGGAYNALNGYPQPVNPLPQYQYLK